MLHLNCELCIEFALLERASEAVLTMPNVDGSFTSKGTHPDRLTGAITKQLWGLN